MKEKFSAASQRLELFAFSSILSKALGVTLTALAIGKITWKNFVNTKQREIYYRLFYARDEWSNFKELRVNSFGGFVVSFAVLNGSGELFSHNAKNYFIGVLFTSKKRLF